MNKKGYTVVDLVIVIAVLGIMTVFMISKVSYALSDDNSQMYDLEVKLIETQAKAYGSTKIEELKQNDSIDEAFANFESEQRNKEIEDFANKQEINAEFLKQTISDYEFSNTINKKDIITGIDRPIKFKEKHELVAKIIQFIKENVFKYQ